MIEPVEEGDANSEYGDVPEGEVPVMVIEMGNGKRVAINTVQARLMLMNPEVQKYPELVEGLTAFVKECDSS